MNTNIINLKTLTQKPMAFSLLEFEAELSELPKGINPYLAEDIKLSINLKSSAGKEITADAFYFEEYNFESDMALKDRTDKKPCFRFRISPTASGIWNYTVNLQVKGEISDNLNGSIEIGENKNGSKILSIEPKRKQVFATEDGTPVFLIGENLFWQQPEKDIKLYAQHIIENMKILAHNGVNHIRLVDNVESGVSIRAKVHYMRQDSSAMLDKILKAAEDLGVYVSFVFLHISDTNGFSNAEKMWNTANGGYIDDAKLFFSDENTKKAVKDYMRYVVCRWGYSEYIANWELINEIDRNELAWVWGGNFEKQKQWLSEMYNYVRENDPYNHLISASSFFINVMPHLQEHFDFINFHQCNPTGLGMLLAMQSDCNRAYQKPVIVTNTGIDGPRALCSGGILTEDLLVFHQGNWSGIMGGGAGTCMNQAWKELAEFKGEKHYKPVAEMAKLIPWNNPDMRNITAESLPVSNGRIDIMGYEANNNYYLWMYDNRVWPTCRYEEIEFLGETITLEIADGKYFVNWMDIETGESVKSEEITVSKNKTTLSMPTWSKHIALTVTVL